MTWIGRRTLTMIIIALYAGIGVSLVWRSHASTRAAPMRIESQQYNFGRGQIGEVIEHEFVLNNPSDMPVHIDKVTTSCSCTLSQETPEVIPPLASCSIPVRVVLTQDGKDTGSAITVHLRGHDPIQLIVRGTVVRQFPSTISFDKVRRGDGGEKQFTIRSLNDAPLHILYVKGGGDLFAVTHRRSDANPLDVLVSVRLKNDIPYGYFDVSLDVTTDDDVAPVKQVRIQGYVMKPVEAEPSVLTFGSIALNETKTRIVRIRPVYGDPISVDHLEADPQGVIECTVPQTASPDGSIEMAVAVKGSFPHRMMNGTIHIYVRVNEEVRKCTVTCYAMREKPL